ncbi:GNAT family N-acetyltransferase [Marivibrio halodurans]|uniref:GNAT family N-acetyltransferase n=1 Tax=Marivibrio halodurans TaxID=2039722 RepID=A0A8J7S5X0_9PROT|nr:GNAT family N-acetyltransferase [Marivibrio halodurans]MBP5856162.1 GNAT family N-acetyltransferase [Marivibrio halodurans]
MRRATPKDARAIERLIRPVFEAQVAPTLEETGRRTFRAFVTAPALAGRLSAGSPAFLVEGSDGRPVAYGERDGAHIRLMFVALDRQGNGVSRLLLEALIADVEAPAVTLNSSDFARARYESLGFTATGPRTMVNGIVHTPMMKPLDGMDARVGTEKENAP